jgi:NAD(P)-dependent dehydrogenase (short-subunit alcohol dehydrogenase family)
VGKIDFDDLHFAKRMWMGGWMPYCQSKLCNVLFARSLARRLEATGGVAHAVHPGTVATGFLASGNGALARASMSMARPFLRTPAKGASTLIWAASAPEPATFSGAYLADCKVAKASKRGQNDADAERLWALSAELCGSSVA